MISRAAAAPAPIARGCATPALTGDAQVLDRARSPVGGGQRPAAVRPGGQSDHGHRVRLQRFYLNGSSASLSRAAGREPDFARPGVLTGRSTRTVAVCGRPRLDEDCRIARALEREHVDRAFARHGRFLGVARRF